MSILIKGVFIDLVMPVAFGVYLLWLLWSVYNGKIPPSRSNVSMLAVGIPLVLLYLFTETPPRLIDYFFYLRKGETYVQVTTCTVESVTKGLVSKLLLGNETLWCDDGKPYRLYYQRTYQRWEKKGRTFRIYYLPRSQLVLRLEPVSP